MHGEAPVPVDPAARLDALDHQPQVPGSAQGLGTTDSRPSCGHATKPMKINFGGYLKKGGDGFTFNTSYKL